MLNRILIVLVMAVCLVLPGFAGAEEEDAEVRRLPDTIASASFSIFQKKPLRIAVITLSELSTTQAALTHTLREIRQAFAPYPVIFERRKSIGDLEKEIEDHTVDGFIASAGFVWKMMKLGAIPLATLISDETPNPNKAIASVFIARRDDKTIEKLADMKGKTLSASYYNAFMSYRTGMAELAMHGYDPENFFKDIIYLGDTFNSLIADEVLEGNADVALVRACWLESIPEVVSSQFKVINRQYTDDLKCVRSSSLYPNLTFAITSGAPPGTAYVIARTLLLMKPVGSKNYHWGISTDRVEIDRLYRLLKIEDYQYLREPTLKRWISEHKAILFLASLLILGLFLHSWRVAYLVRKRSAELRSTLKLQLQTQIKVQRLLDRLDKMQKATVVGQISNMIAHELAQPLSVIQHYSDALKVLIKNKKAKPELLEKASSGLQRGVDRTAKIVNKVRSYSHQAVDRTKPVRLQSIFGLIGNSINPDLTENCASTVPEFEDTEVRGDSLEIELLFYNLMKNAYEAAKSDPKPSVSVSYSVGNGKVTVRIENSGKAITQEQIENIKTPLMSSKSHGLGLGISIAVSIAEASGGHVAFRPKDGGGLIATVELEQYKDDDYS